MKKFLMLIIFVCAAISSSAALAGATKRVSINIETVVPADAELNQAMLALKMLEDSPNLDINTYKIGVAEIIAAFIVAREDDYRDLKGIEVLTASAEALRPAPFKGRNKDSATITSDTARFANWDVSDVYQAQLRQMANGANSATVARLPDFSGVTLTVQALSAKHDSFRGRTHRTEQVAVHYKMSEEEVRRRARADAANLLLLMGLASN